MKEFCFASFIGTVKRHCCKVSNEAIVCDLMTDIYTCCQKENKFGDECIHSKEVASLLLRRKEGVPANFKSALLDSPFSSVRKGVEKALSCYILSSEKDAMLSELMDCYRQSQVFKDDVNKYEEMYDLLAYYLIQTAYVDNKLANRPELVIERGNTEVNVIYGDLLAKAFNAKNTKEPKIIVIPVDADFNMHVSKLGEKPFIVSPNTIHGKWILKMKEKGYSEEQILQKMHVNGKGTIGSIATLPYNDNMFWLLAVSKMDENYNARSTGQDVRIALESLISFYDREGQGYTMYLPLIGTGMSRAGLGNDDSYNMIKEIIKNKMDDIYGKITIVKYINSHEK